MLKQSGEFSAVTLEIHENVGSLTKFHYTDEGSNDKWMQRAREPVTSFPEHNHSRLDAVLETTQVVGAGM